MARRENFKVSITPKEALDLVKENENADLVHEEIHNLGKMSILEHWYLKNIS